jgi:spore germination protein KA
MSVSKYFQKRYEHKYRQFDKAQKEQGPEVSNQKVPDQIVDDKRGDHLDGSLEHTFSFLKEVLGENDDFVIRRFQLFGRYPAALFFFSNLIKQEVINIDILKPLMYGHGIKEDEILTPDSIKDNILNKVLYHSQTLFESELGKLVDALLRGETVLVVDGLNEAFRLGTRSVEKRSVDQPQTELVILGPREGFIEQLWSNIGLLRYRLQTADFRVKTLQIGRVSKSEVAVCYLEGIAESALVEEVFNRLSKIDIDVVLDAGYLEQFIEDHHLSPFPQVHTTERPDKTVANILEGRVAILVDGSPFSLLVPVVFNQFYQTTEDYSSRVLMGSFVRLARLIALVFSLIFPSLYVSFISFNPELLPTEFAVAVAGGRAGVPFPAVIEVLIIEVSMEVLREATVRLPQQVGGALSDWTFWSSSYYRFSTLITDH